MKEGDREGELFGDYYPKNEPDTVFDYLADFSGGNECVAVLKRLPPAEPRHLKTLLASFDEYAEKAKKNPGTYVEGNPLLGAPTREYKPSGEELVLAEIGDRIKTIVNTTPRAELREYMARQALAYRRIDYDSFAFTHTDVMGSGRFFYASSPCKEVISIG